MDAAIQPGAMLGMLGGGQLGRLFVQAAQALGYRVSVLDPDPLSPAGQIANRHLQAAYTDPAALAELATTCAAVSIEFENIPLSSLLIVANHVRLTPTTAAMEIAQNRILEKQFLRAHNLATANFHPIATAADIPPALAAVGTPCILKTATLGYDGKGQVVCQTLAEIESAFARLQAVPCVLEEQIDLYKELSVVLARSDSGQITCFPAAENTHRNGILITSLAPAQLDSALLQEAQDMATTLAHALAYTGLLGVEMFISQTGDMLINEMAPRPHNSGHYTLDATTTSQFAQQVRILCGLPTGDTTLQSPVAMLNLLGEVWANGEPDWQTILPKNARLCLYRKAAARPGRKMGHINVLAPSAREALATVHRLGALLYPQEEGPE